MDAQHILTATHELEETGMTRSQSEAIAKTIVAAVAPLATRADLKATRADLKVTKADLESSINSLKEQMATKSDLESQKEQMATKADLKSLKEQMATKKDVESVKVWYLVTLLGLLGSLLVIDVI